MHLIAHELLVFLVVPVAHRMATSVVAGKLWRLTICAPLASCVAVNKLHTVGELVAVGNLCGS
jgi:hypothetical protein